MVENEENQGIKVSEDVTAAATLQVKEGKEDIDFSKMTVDEMAAFSKNNLLTVDQMSAIDTNTKEKTGKAKRIKPKRIAAEEKGPLKEDDVIHYMYNEWLIAGANWLWGKGVKRCKQAWYNAQRHIGTRERKAKANFGAMETYKFKDEIKTMMLDNMEAAVKTADQNKHTIEHFKQIRETDFNDPKQVAKLNLSPEMVEDLKKISPKARQDLYSEKNAEKFQKYNNDRAVRLIETSYMLAAAKLMDRKAKDKDAFNGLETKTLLNQAVGEANIEACKLISNIYANGGSFAKTENAQNEMHELAKAAYEKSVKNIEKGKFHEAGKEPGVNKHLNKIGKITLDAKEKAEGLGKTDVKDIFIKGAYNQILDRENQGVKQNQQALEAREISYADRKKMLEFVKNKRGISFDQDTHQTGQKQTKPQAPFVKNQTPQGR